VAVGESAWRDATGREREKKKKKKDTAGRGGMITGNVNAPGRSTTVKLVCCFFKSSWLQKGIKCLKKKKGEVSRIQAEDLHENWVCCLLAKRMR
jgi:hypothetical protein